MKLPVYNLAGEICREIEVRDNVFGVNFNRAVVHQALVRQQASARQGGAKTKTRGEVAGSTRKLYLQKHTGRARAGSIKSPLRRGGGVIFGPRPRDYREDMPKKMRRLAIRCVLSAKAAEGNLMIIEEAVLERPGTKVAAHMLRRLGVLDSVLVGTCEPSSALLLSMRNLARVKTLPARMLNVADMLSFKTLLLTEASVRQIEGLWGTNNNSTDSSVTDAAA